VRGDVTVSDRAAGERLKQAIHIARAKANILYDTDLAVRAGVSYDTFMNWYGGKTVPRGAELRKVAQTLGLQYADLMAAYEGIAPEQPPLQETVSELVGLLRPIVEQAVDREARLRAVEAELRSLRERPANGVSPTQPAPHGRGE
jgi:transcriptional regulator with XRE-family HTH domain